jgi:Uma2 family endonuclease
MNSVATPIQVPGAPARMSFEDFLRWQHSGIAEWVNGEVFQMSVKNEHQRVVDFLNRVIGFFVEMFGLGILRSAPYVMRTSESSGREPDLMFVSAANVHRITSEHLDGPADLVIEVISDESVVRDRITKMEEYEAASVREYWIIDPRPNKHRAEFFVLDKDRQRFQPVPVGSDNIYRSSVIDGLWLNVEWLWAEQPNAVAAFREITKGT